ncbi:MAG TPA: PAS domain-containing protein, partial [Trebonia sp.]|nr:PAS domain-containing protein [Trebonia sp.]
MAHWNEGVFDSDLSAELVLRQAEIGVIVADRQGNVLFANEHVAALLRLPSDASKIAGQPLHALGFIPDGDLPKAAQLSRQVLSGMTWEGTFTGSR